MDKIKTLVCQAVPNIIYISKPEKIKVNSFTISLVSADAAGASRNCTEVASTKGAALITVQCDWNSGTSSLCTLEDAKNIRVSGEAWKVRWKRIGWEVTPPQGADLSNGFQLSLRFDNVVTDLQEGTAVLHIVLHHFPGYDEEAPFTAAAERRYALSVDSFESDKPKVEYGDSCNLNWRVINSSRCFLDGMEVKPQDSYTVFPRTDPQTYTLLAGNEYGDIIRQGVSVYLTNWRNTETVSQQVLPLNEDTCDSNAEIYKYEGNYYTFAAQSLYTTDDMEKPDWKKLTGPEAGKDDFDFYTCLCRENYFLVLCQTVLYKYSFSEESWNSEEISLDYGDNTACRAVLFQDIPLYAAIYEKRMIILSYYDDKHHIWDTNYFLDAKAEIDSFDMAEFQGSLYVALRKKSGGTIIYRTEDLEDWKKIDALDCSKWFRLFVCKRRLFLIWRNGIADLEGGTLYEDFPDLPEEGACIRVCMASDRVYLACPGTEDTIKGYRFRP